MMTSSRFLLLSSLDKNTTNVCFCLFTVETIVRTTYFVEISKAKIAKKRLSMGDSRFKGGVT